MLENTSWKKTKQFEVNTTEEKKKKKKLNRKKERTREATSSAWGTSKRPMKGECTAVSGLRSTSERGRTEGSQDRKGG